MQNSLSCTQNPCARFSPCGRFAGSGKCLHIHDLPDKHRPVGNNLISGENFILENRRVAPQRRAARRHALLLHLLNLKPELSRLSFTAYTVWELSVGELKMRVSRFLPHLALPFTVAPFHLSFLSSDCRFSRNLRLQK